LGFLALIVRNQLQKNIQIWPDINLDQRIVFVLDQAKGAKGKILFASILNKLTVTCNLIQLFNVMLKLFGRKIVTERKSFTLIAFYCL
jgi:hypothetical protein